MQNRKFFGPQSWGDNCARLDISIGIDLDNLLVDGARGQAADAGSLFGA